MGQLTVDSGQLTAEEQVEVALMKVQFDLVHREAQRLEDQCKDVVVAYSALKDVCRSVARCEGKSAAEWRDVAVAHQAALVETTATMNRYHGDWQKAVALVSDLQAQVEQLTMDNGFACGERAALTTKEAGPSDAALAALAEVIHEGAREGCKPDTRPFSALTPEGYRRIINSARAAFAYLRAPESVRVDAEKKGRLAAEERVLALEQQMREERAESSRTIAHLKDQWVEARELLSSNFANERAGLHEQLAELRARNEELQKGAAELLAGVEVVAGAVGPVADALRRQLAAAKGEEVLTRPGAPAATDGTDSTDGVVVEGGAV